MYVLVVKYKIIVLGNYFFFSKTVFIVKLIWLEHCIILVIAEISKCSNIAKSSYDGLLLLLKCDMLIKHV